MTWLGKEAVCPATRQPHADPVAPGVPVVPVILVATWSCWSRGGAAGWRLLWWLLLKPGCMSQSRTWRTGVGVIGFRAIARPLWNASDYLGHFFGCYFLVIKLVKNCAMIIETLKENVTLFCRPGSFWLLWLQNSDSNTIEYLLRAMHTTNCLHALFYEK